MSLATKRMKERFEHEQRHNGIPEELMQEMDLFSRERTCQVSRRNPNQLTPQISSRL